MSGTMLAPLTTLVFLSVLWLLGTLGAAVLSESGAKIAAALRGDGVSDGAVMVVASRGRGRVRPQQPRFAGLRLRAAA